MAVSKLAVKIDEKHFKPTGFVLLQIDFIVHSAIHFLPIGDYAVMPSAFIAKSFALL
jgi:hypothetical protein